MAKVPKEELESRRESGKRARLADTSAEVATLHAQNLKLKYQLAQLEKV